MLLTIAALLLSLAACNFTARNSPFDEIDVPEDLDYYVDDDFIDIEDIDSSSDEEYVSQTQQQPITISWWGGEWRHEATNEALAKFEELNPDIKTSAHFGAWDGWEQYMATGLMSGTASDVCQLSWDWLYLFTNFGQNPVLTDLNDFSDIIELTQFPDYAIKQCVINEEILGIPVSTSGRLFLWNEATFERAGTSVPKTLEELYTATTAIKNNLGDDHFPLVLGEYDRMILMVYYLQSIYGKPWVVNNVLQYSESEIAVGYDLFTEWEERGVIPTIFQLTSDGAQYLDVNPKWIDGRYGGVFEWDSFAPKYEIALDSDQRLVLGDFFPDFGGPFTHQGYGFSKISMVFSIATTANDKENSAKLIEFLLNDDVGTSIMGSERGIPLSRKALENTRNQGLLDELTTEANQKVLNWVQFPLDPLFEDAELRFEDGVYYRTFARVSANTATSAEAAKMLSDEITRVLQS